MNLTPQYKKMFNNALDKSALKATKQREHIFSLILEKRDHPTADEIYTRSKVLMPKISLATIYNCLDTLVESGLIKQVNFEREPSRYCPNLKPHAHFLCKKTGKIHDVSLPLNLIEKIKEHLPKSFKADQIDINFNGTIK